MNVSRLFEARKLTHSTVILLLMTPFPEAIHAAELTLATILKKVEQQNIEFKASQDHISVAEEISASTRAKFLPRVDLESKYTHLNDSIDLDLDPIRTAMIGSAQTAAGVNGGPNAAATTAGLLNSSLPPFKQQIQEQNYFNAALTLVQPLYMGGKLSANKEARIQELEVARLESRDVLEKVLVASAQAYFSVRLAELNLRVRSEILEGLKDHQDISAKLLAEGQITKIAKMNADLKVREAEAAHIKAVYDRDLSRKVLSNLINEDIGSAQLSTDLNLKAELGSLADYQRKAQVGNKAVRIAATKAQMLDDKYAGIRADYLPSVFAFGRYELYRENLTALEPEWLVGIGLRMNIFAGGETRDSLAAVVAEQSTVRKHIEVANQTVHLAVEKTYSDLQSAKEQLKFFDAALQVAEESVRLNNAAFRGGSARSIEVTDAYNNLGQIKLARLKCQSDFNNAYFQLQRLTGEADEMGRVVE